jgi:hypothetical protein
MRANLGKIWFMQEQADLPQPPSKRGLAWLVASLILAVGAAFYLCVSGSSASGFPWP